MIAKQTVYLDENRKAVVAGPAARILLVREGQEIPEKSYVGIEGAAALIGASASKSSPKGDAGKNLQERTVPELRQLAEAKGIDTAGLKKQELIDALEE